MTLKELRKSRDLTLNEISEMLGVTVPTYHRWESGKVSPNSESLIKIAETMKVNVNISFETGQIEYDAPVPEMQNDYPDEVWDAALKFAAEVHGMYKGEEE